MNIWSQFTLESFLESNIDVIKAKVPEDSRRDLDVETLAKLLPWSNDAVRGYIVFTYNPFLDMSFVELLRDGLGKWWSRNMNALVGGMHSLADGFFSRDVLKETDDLETIAQVFKVSYFSFSSSPNRDWVEVSCYETEQHPKRTYTAQVIFFDCYINLSMGCIRPVVVANINYNIEMSTCSYSYKRNQRYRCEILHGVHALAGFKTKACCLFKSLRYIKHEVKVYPVSFPLSTSILYNSATAWL